MKFARPFRMDNPLVDFGNAPYQPGEAINLCYDNFGPPAALLRGLFEYLYRAEGLTLLPHIPPGISRLEQHFPVRFGTKRLYLATTGTGPITAVRINDQPWPLFDARSITLPYDQTPNEGVIQIALGGAKPVPFVPRKAVSTLPPELPLQERQLPPEQVSAITPNQLPLRFGADSHGGSRFLGDIGRVRLYRRALRPAEMATLAEAHQKSLPLPKDPALVGDWSFTNQKDHLFPNALGKSLSAKIVGKAQVVDVSGSKAIQLDGKGFLEVGMDPQLNLQACTMEAWIRPGKQAAAGGRIIDKTGVGTSNGYLLDTHPGNSLRLIAERGSLSFDARLAPERWVHVAGTIAADGSQALYVDGKQVAFQKLSLSGDLAGLEERIAQDSKVPRPPRSRGPGGPSRGSPGSTGRCLLQRLFCPAGARQKWPDRPLAQAFPRRRRQILPDNREPVMGRVGEDRQGQQGFQRPRGSTNLRLLARALKKSSTESKRRQIVRGVMRSREGCGQ